MKKRISRQSWKTASAGILAISTVLIGYISVWVETGHYPGSVATIALIGTLLNAIGNLVARDNDKTSAEVGADLFEKRRDQIDEKKLIQ